jgi:DNA mismatch endonuclease, patch repair protein
MSGQRQRAAWCTGANKTSMDTVTKAVRSRNMAAVKHKDSQIERTLRRALWAAGIRYRKHLPMFGRPDLVISNARILVFVDSCFWHGCRYHYRCPQSNREFWRRKVEGNKKRDLKVTRYHRRRGWTVVRLWEHQLRADLGSCVGRVFRAIETDRS